MAPQQSFLNKIFGFTFRKESDPKVLSPVAPNPNDGSVVVGAPNQFGYFGNQSTKIDINLTEYQLITRYRDMALNHTVDWAIDEIVNEAIVQDGEEEAVELNLEACDNIPEDAKKIIIETFHDILDLLNWSNEAYQTFRNFYIDGRLYFQILLHQPEIKVTQDTTEEELKEANDIAAEKGIKELRYIDPRQIRKFIHVEKKVDTLTQIAYTDIVGEFYVYSPLGIDYNGTSLIPYGQNPIVGGIPLTKDSVAFVHSGQFDSTSSVILSYLHKSIRPLTQSKSMENATLIYKLARASERRIWKIPTGTMPEKQVPEYLDRLIAQYRSKSAYDAISGDVVDERKVLSIIDDIFIPVPSTGEAVEIDVLPGGPGFDDTSTMDYFNGELMRSLGVPPSRLKQDSGALFGNTGMISVDEQKFSKMIYRLRKQFTNLFDTLMKTQLRLKGIIVEDKDWNYLVSKWKYKFASNNYFAEMSEMSILTQRITAAEEAESLVGTYLSRKWVSSRILKMTEEEAKEEQDQIAIELDEGIIKEKLPPVIDPTTGATIDPETGQVLSMPGQGQPGQQAPQNTQFPPAQAAPPPLSADGESDAGDFDEE